MAHDEVTRGNALHRVPLTRRRFLRDAAAMGAAVGLAPLPIAPAQAADREIKIGYVSPRTGPLAGFGEAADFIIGGLEKRFKEGVAIGSGRHPIKLLWRDSKSNPSRAAEVASGLIWSGKFDLMLVASPPETTNPVGDQCELNEVPCISSMAPWQPWFF